MSSGLYTHHANVCTALCYFIISSISSPLASQFFPVFPSLNLAVLEPYSGYLLVSSTSLLFYACCISSLSVLLLKSILCSLPFLAYLTHKVFKLFLSYLGKGYFRFCSDPPIGKRHLVCGYMGKIYPSTLSFMPAY